MRIRTIDQDFNRNQLDFFWGGNGDVYVTIYENGVEDSDAQYHQMGRPVSVRVGMTSSGMRIPSKIRELIADLATEFEKYRDFEFERDAWQDEFNKECDKLRGAL